jgi:hypothetical protein
MSSHNHIDSTDYIARSNAIGSRLSELAHRASVMEQDGFQVSKASRAVHHAQHMIEIAFSHSYGSDVIEHFNHYLGMAEIDLDIAEGLLKTATKAK